MLTCKCSYLIGNNKLKYILTITENKNQKLNSTSQTHIKILIN